MKLKRGRPPGRAAKTNEEMKSKFTDAEREVIKRIDDAIADPDPTDELLDPHKDYRPLLGADGKVHDQLVPTDNFGERRYFGYVPMLSCLSCDDVKPHEFWRVGAHNWTLYRCKACDNKRQWGHGHPSEAPKAYRHRTPGRPRKEKT